MPKNIVQVFGFSDFCPTFAENYVMEVDIRYALKINGVSIEDLAQRMGVNRQTVYYYIKQGDKNPLSQLERIADAIGIPVTDLFEEREREPIFDVWCPSCGNKIQVELRVVEPKIPDHENIRGKEYYE
jgi:transcriptional regulator with XRE-family HTH domain